MATSTRCPICDRPARPLQENRSFPFCGDRCRLLDLSKWFGGEYRIAGPHLGEDEDGPAAPGEGEEDA